MRLASSSLLVVAAFMATACSSAPHLSAPLTPPGAFSEAHHILTAEDQVEETRIFGRVFVEPNEMHLGVWQDVATCLGIVRPPRPWRIYWAIADAIKTPDGFLAYGVTEVSDGFSLGITVETPFWFNASVVSHEIVHVLDGSFDHEGPEWECVMNVGVGLEARRAEEES